MVVDYLILLTIVLIFDLTNSLSDEERPRINIDIVVKIRQIVTFNVKLPKVSEYIFLYKKTDIGMISIKVLDIGYNISVKYFFIGSLMRGYTI